MISKMNGWAGAKKTKMQDSGELLSSTAAPFGYSNYRSEMRAFAHKKFNTSTKGTKLSKDTIVNSIYSCTVHVCNWYNRTIKLYTGLSENFFALPLNEADPSQHWEGVFRYSTLPPNGVFLNMRGFYGEKVSLTKTFTIPKTF